MNWKKEAVSDLRNYLYRKQSLENITEKIKALRYELEGVKAVKIDPTPGGGNHMEDKRVNTICEIERLKLAYQATKKLVDIIERSLDLLSEQERIVLQLFYIERPRNYIEELSKQLNMEQANIYRVKDTALNKFTVLMYGIMDY